MSNEACHKDMAHALHVIDKRFLLIRASRLLLSAFGIALLLQNQISAGTPGAVTYSYDALGRLTLVSSPDGTNSSYIYDPAGNRKSIDTGADVTAPSVPLALHTTSMTSTTVNLAWNNSTDTGGSGLAGYYIYRNASSTALGSSAVASYSDTTTSGTTNYQYVVKAYDHAGNISSPSSMLPVTTPDTIAPPQVTGLKAAGVSSSQVNLSWNIAVDTGGSGTSYYKVYRNSAFIANVFAPVVSYQDTTGLSGSTSYSYTVQAVDGAGNIGLLSAIAPATTPDTIAPPKVTGLAATAVSASQINLSWNIAVDTGGSGTSYYKVYRNSAFQANVAAPTVSYPDSGLAGSTTYSYTVQAVDGAGNIGLLSDSASAKTLVPFTAPGTPSGYSPTMGVASIVWGASTGGTAPYTYYLEGCFGTPCNFAAIGFTASTSFTATGLVHAVVYSFRVRAKDSTGAYSPYSGVGTISIQ